MEIEVKIRALMMDPNSGTPIIILKDVNSETMLPIWVGAYEANAIALEIEKIAPPRPMTHDLLRNLIVELGLKVEMRLRWRSEPTVLSTSTSKSFRHRGTRSPPTKRAKPKPMAERKSGPK